MAIEILSGSKIRSRILEILLGLYLHKVNPEFPKLYILSPWLSDPQIGFGEVDSIRKDLLRRHNIDFPHRYNIESVNLAYALLLLRIYYGVEINIVTLPPEYPYYNKKRVSPTKLLLDFLDEIGCNIFLNAQLHAKLILSNDLALLGSCNLSKSALYDKEELAVCINDIDNLRKLEDHAMNIIRLSQPSGFTSMHWSGYDKIHRDAKGEYGAPPKYKFTRGWLLEKIIEWTVGRYKTILVPPALHSCVFIFFEEAKSFHAIANSISSNLDAFYMRNIEKLLAISGDPYKLHLATTTSTSDIYDVFLNLSSVELWQEIQRWRKDETRWGGDPFMKVLGLANIGWVNLERGKMPSPRSLKCALDYIKENLARESVPTIKLRIKSLD